MPSGVLKVLLIAVGGAAGALARYGLGGWVQNRLGDSTFPWGTLAVNVTGCLVIGLVWVLGEEKAMLSPQGRLLLMTGLLGAFTTFSTFGLETVGLVSKGQWLAAGGNIAGNVLLGLIAVLGGMAIARSVWGSSGV